MPTLRTRPWLPAAAVLLLAASAAPLQAASPKATVEDSLQTLNEIMRIPAKGIPRAMFADAQGIAIIPDVVKLGFVIAGRHGRGVALIRKPDGTWGNPIFISFTGGSIGWQVGVQATDVILVFKSRKGVAGLLSGKFTLGADAAVAAGPVGRQAEAATDAQLKAEIYSYSRSRGLFAGVSLEGSAVTIDNGANGAYYGRIGITPAEIQAGLLGNGGVGAETARLQATLAALAPPDRRQLIAAPAALPGPVVAPQPGPVGAADPLRKELAAASLKLAAVLDDRWRHYLALPAEVYAATSAPPSVDALRASLAHYDTVRADPKYRALTEMPQFRAVDDLLRRYVQDRLAATSLRRPLLPPPPGDPSAGWHR